MLAVQFIIGQLNVPVNQIIGFFRLSQDALMSIGRLAEVHDLDEEDRENELKIRRLPLKRDIFINNLSFQYEGPHSPFVLKDIDLHVAQNEVTAIVGPSGSGKTTLLKMLLRFYQPVKGEILIGDIQLPNVSLRTWREKTGAVMQDGFLFPDTIAFNIAPGIEDIDEDKLERAVELSNIKTFIYSMPAGFNTKIGANGVGLSQGQVQRLLIARVIYKNPEIIFFDEATNALDALNEKVIVENLAGFFKNKTVLIAAHRLSTVKNADKIVVMDNGKIIETGNHKSLIEKGGSYFHLVKNQLEL
jgi:ATP-binding cassette subfamily B protein